MCSRCFLLHICGQACCWNAGRCSLRAVSNFWLFPGTLGESVCFSGYFWIFWCIIGGWPAYFVPPAVLPYPPLKWLASAELLLAPPWSFFVYRRRVYMHIVSPFNLHSTLACRWVPSPLPMQLCILRMVMKHPVPKATWLQIDFQWMTLHRQFVTLVT